MESLKPDCACGLQRKAPESCPRASTGHFLQCGSKARPAELRRFSAILAVIRPDFSAAQTVWRRDRDSNLRCLLCRPVQHAITSRPENRFSIRIRENCPFPYSAEWRTPGYRRLKVASFETLSAPNSSYRSARRPGDDRGANRLTHVPALAFRHIPN
jgi:hypothetical protein